MDFLDLIERCVCLRTTYLSKVGDRLGAVRQCLEGMLVQTELSCGPT